MKAFALLFALLICHPVLASVNVEEIAVQSFSATIAVIIVYAIIRVADLVITKIQRQKRRKKQNDSIFDEMVEQIMEVEDKLRRLNDEFESLKAKYKKQKKVLKKIVDFVDTLEVVNRKADTTVPLREVRQSISKRVKEESGLLEEEAL